MDIKRDLLDNRGIPHIKLGMKDDESKELIVLEPQGWTVHDLHQYRLELEEIWRPLEGFIHFIAMKVHDLEKGVDMFVKPLYQTGEYPNLKLEGLVVRLGKGEWYSENFIYEDIPVFPRELHEKGYEYYDFKDASLNTISLIEPLLRLVREQEDILEEDKFLVG